MLQVLATYFLGHGRIGRTTWLARTAILATLCVAFGLLAGVVAGEPGQAVCAMIFLWGAGAAAIQRLHDIGKGGADLLMLLIPAVGPLWMLMLLCRHGAEGTNRHGLDPKARLDYLRVDIARQP